MITHDWGVNFNLLNPLSSFDRMALIYQTTIYSPEYHFVGNERVGQGNCIFQYTLSGSGVFDDGEKEYQLTPGTGFLVKANNPKYRYYYPDGVSENWTVLWCSMYGRAITDMVDEINSKYGFVFHVNRNGAVIKKMESYYKPELYGYNIHASENALLVQELIHEIVVSQEASGLKSCEEYLINQAFDYLAKQTQALVSVTQLATFLQVSREHLSRVFRRQLNVSPYQFIIDQKVEQAKLSLRFSSLSIKEIADQLGFKQTTHFSAVFKQKTGISPKSYRYSGTQ